MTLSSRRRRRCWWPATPTRGDRVLLPLRRGVSEMRRDRPRGAARLSSVARPAPMDGVVVSPPRHGRPPWVVRPAPLPPSSLDPVVSLLSLSLSLTSSSLSVGGGGDTCEAGSGAWWSSLRPDSAPPLRPPPHGARRASTPALTCGLGRRASTPTPRTPSDGVTAGRRWGGGAWREVKAGGGFDAVVARRRAGPTCVVFFFCNVCLPCVKSCGA
jgi:hypothetical protein